jgi:Lipocalin-like domain
MKRRTILAVLTVGAIWAGTWPTACAENALVGTWQLTSFSLTVVDTKETNRPYGDRPTGYLQFSPGGHMVMFLAAGELKPPGRPDAIHGTRWDGDGLY